MNDYEGIEGYDHFRGDLGFMYLVTMDPTRRELVHLRMIPFQIRNFRINQASHADSVWLSGRLDRECRKLGTRVRRMAESGFTLEWKD